MSSATWRALGTKVVLVVSDAPALTPARRILADHLAAIDNACSRFRPDSELSRVNAAAGNEVRVSELFLAAARTALAAAEATDGLVDPTIGKALRLAGYDRTFADVGDRTTTIRPVAVRGRKWRDVELDERRRTVRIPDGVELDLGATAKALAADRAALDISNRADTGVLVSLGGDVSVAGPSPPGGWPIRIADDSSAPIDGPGPVVTIASGGLATSGTDVRRWRTADGEAHHIIDPRTGLSAVGYWRTVTVTAASCVDANTASTAAVVLGDSAPGWLSALGLPARLVHCDGAVTCVARWPAEAA